MTTTTQTPGQQAVTAALAANQAAADQAQAAAAALYVDGRFAGTDATFAAYQDANARLMGTVATLAQALTTHMLDGVLDDGPRAYDLPTLRVHTPDQRNMRVSEVLGKGAIVLTQDGRRADTSAWHRTDVDGPATGDDVFVERYSAAGREFHGYVDPVSRKLTQTG